MRVHLILGCDKNTGEYGMSRTTTATQRRWCLWLVVPQVKTQMLISGAFVFSSEVSVFESNQERH